MTDVPPPVIIAAPPRPPAQFSQDYANQLYRWQESLARYVAGVNLLRGSGLYLPGLPTNGYGLKAGEVFSNAGVLTIVRTDDIWVGPLSASAFVGSVTVTTS